MPISTSAFSRNRQSSLHFASTHEGFELNSHPGACRSPREYTLQPLPDSSSGEWIAFCSHKRKKNRYLQPSNGLPATPIKSHKSQSLLSLLVTSMYSCTATPRARHVPRSPSGPETLLLCSFRGNISNGGRRNAIPQERANNSSRRCFHGEPTVFIGMRLLSPEEAG